MTCGACVGRVLSHFFELLYEQCSENIAENIPNSVLFGVFFIFLQMKLNSSWVKPISIAVSRLLSCWTIYSYLLSSYNFFFKTFIPHPTIFSIHLVKNFN